MNTFEQLGLNENLVKAIKDLGFENPTPIQAQAIPVLLSEPTDLVGLAQTGTGKTAAFGLPLIQSIDFEKKHTQALILCPTRELCNQITKDLKNFTKYYKSANVVAIYGGASIDTQIRQLHPGAQIIVGTPGRMIDMIDRRKINLNAIQIVVLDEADEMLNMGFKEDIDIILTGTPDTKSTWLFSATMPKEVATIAKKYMDDPFEISVGEKNKGAENITHEYYVVHERDRYQALKRLVDANTDIFGIIFCRTKIDTQQIAENLIRDGYNADALHGDLSQVQRDKVMQRYRTRHLQLLIATDVAARGIDVSDVTHVIHYKLPDDVENYTHRSGRTARAGKKGVSIALVNAKELNSIREIERLVKTKFERKLIPSGFEVCEKQLMTLVKKIHDVQVNEDEIKDYLPAIIQELSDLSKEDLVKKFVSIEFNRFINYYKNSGDLNIDTTRTAAKQRGMDWGKTGMARIFVNLGEMDDFNKGGAVRLICDNTGLNNSSIGKIDIKQSFSFFEVESDQAEAVLNALNKAEHNGRKVKVELANTGSGKDGTSGGFRDERRSSGGGGGGRGSYGSGFKSRRDGDSRSSDSRGSAGGREPRPRTERKEGGFTKSFDRSKRGGGRRGD